jgi:hypothetical protein
MLLISLASFILRGPRHAKPHSVRSTVLEGEITAIARTRLLRIPKSDRV